MTMPFHRFKHTYRAVGTGKHDTWCTTEFYGCLGTGLYDRNGVEIYEGDLIKFGDESEIYTVIFDDAAFWLGSNEYFLYHFEPSELEVVGHITEEGRQ